MNKSKLVNSLKLRQKFEKATKTHWVNEEGNIDIDCVYFLENKIESLSYIIEDCFANLYGSVHEDHLANLKKAFKEIIDE